MKNQFRDFPITTVMLIPQKSQDQLITQAIASRGQEGD